MQKINVISKKYDGSLRDEFQAFLHAETEETITLFSLPGAKYWYPPKAAWLEAPDGLIQIYFKHRWYNVWHICEQVSQFNLLYVNIAMPPTILADGMSWVDLDIDYRVHMDYAIERLDQAEFIQNSQKMGYPPDLIDVVQAACQEVEAGLKNQAWPFDHKQQVKLYWQIKENWFNLRD